MTKNFLDKYKISDKNLNSHKWGDLQAVGTVDWFIICNICDLHVFWPEESIPFYTTFDMFMDLSCDEMLIKSIIK